MTEQTRSAGWYPDPDGDGQRWWNGVGWSDTRRAGAGAAASTPYAPEPPEQAGVSPIVGATAVPPVVPPPAGPPPPLRVPSVIYSADNPAPEIPDPYGQPGPAPAVWSGTSVNVRLNRNAMIGFVLGLVALFGVFSVITGPLAVVLSLTGIVKARQLAAQGIKGNLLVFAAIGLVAGAIGAVVGIISVVAFFGSVVSTIDVSQ